MAANIHQPLQPLTREQFWRHHIRQWQDSGLSKMRYSRENDVPYHQLIYWCDKLCQSSETPEEANSKFVSVAVAPAEAREAATLSVKLPNGICITGVNQETVDLVPQLLRCL